MSEEDQNSEERDVNADAPAQETPASPPPEESKRNPIVRLVLAMFIGLFVLEVILETTAGISLMGGRNGIFIREPEHKATIVHSDLNADGKVLQATDIRDQPSMTANRVGKLERGVQLRLIGKTLVDEAPWYRVERFGGKIGFVDGKTIFIEKHIPKE